MFGMYLDFFTKDKEFPFYIQRGQHDTALFTHTHFDFSELTVVLDGTALHCVDNEVYFIKHGDVFVINGGIEHGYRSPNNLKICNIMFRTDKIFNADSDICRSIEFKRLFVPESCSANGFQSRLTLPHESFEKINTLLSEMLCEFERKENGWKTLVEANFTAVVVMFSRVYSLPSNDSKVNIINIDKAVSYIEKNYVKQISISELASMSYLSERHFARVFKQIYKVTPGSYILELRMQRACILLKNTSLNVSEIALQCGFNNGNYFTRQFYKSFFITPQKYRIKNENKIH